jgi:hypothetical protein
LFLDLITHFPIILLVENTWKTIYNLINPCIPFNLLKKLVKKSKSFQALIYFSVDLNVINHYHSTSLIEWNIWAPNLIILWSDLQQQTIIYLYHCFSASFFLFMDLKTNKINLWIKLNIDKNFGLNLLFFVFCSLVLFFI